jgi:hypothetical protein
VTVRALPEASVISTPDNPVSLSDLTTVPLSDPCCEKAYVELKINDNNKKMSLLCFILEIKRYG